LKKIRDNIIKTISKQDISIKDNYKLFRLLENATSLSFFSKYKYEDTYIKLKNRKIKLRIINKNLITKGIIIYVHGGGWVLGSVNSYTNFCKELSDKTKKMVLLIDYRLAPEYKYPAGLNDCYDVIKLIMDNIDKLDINYKDICLMGDSAGANLVASVSLKASKTKEIKIYKQILIYPSLQSDYSNETKYKSVITKGKDYFFTQSKLEEYISLYVKNSNDLKDPYAFPLNKKIITSQPKTLIITADNDPLRDEGKKYAKRLKFWLNDVKYFNFEGAMHGFLTKIIGSKYKKRAIEKVIDFLGD